MARKTKLGRSLGGVWLPVFSLALVLALAAPAAGPVLAGDTTPDTIPIPPTVTLGEAPSLVPAAEDNPKLSSSLAQLLAAGQSGGTTGAQAHADANLLVFGEGQVQVEILSAPEAAPGLVEAIESSGGEYQGSFQDIVQALVPVDAVEALAARAGVRFVREPRRAVLDEATAGSSAQDLTAVMSKGVAVSNADAWHGEGQLGEGVRVAIFGHGFMGYPSLLGSELPDKVKTYDHAGGGLELTPTGTAVAEVVHDMAPGAMLSLHVVTTDVELDTAVDQALADGAGVIITSMIWFADGPGDGTGPLADIAAKARDQGILFVAAAGNLGQTTWSGTFVGKVSNDNVYHAWNGTDKLLNFLGPGDGRCYIKAAGTTIQGALHWDDWDQRMQNYDLRLAYWSGSGPASFVASSTNVQNGPAGPPPEEWISYVAQEAGCYAWVVEKVKAERDVCFRLLTPNASVRLDEMTPERSLPFPADAPSVMAVAAVDVDKPYDLATYSSQGPTFGPGAACTGGKIKPEAAGYTRVETKSLDPKLLTGTGPAAAHVAGAAALVRAAYPGYSVSMVQNFLEDRAIDMGPAGKDTMYGAGRLYLGEPPSEPDYRIWLPTIIQIFPAP